MDLSHHLKKDPAPAGNGISDRKTDSSLTWADAWPVVAERVTRTLRTRGAPSSTIDDALQTAAMRALRRSGGFDSLDGLVKWPVVAAWREVQAEWRHRARVDLGQVPERRDGTDPAAVVEDRLALEVVAGGLAQLSEADRAALLGAIEPTDTGTEPAPLKMRRYRARQRLAALVGSVERQH